MAKHMRDTEGHERRSIDAQRHQPVVRRSIRHPSQCSSLGQCYCPQGQSVAKSRGFDRSQSIGSEFDALLRAPPTMPEGYRKAIRLFCFWDLCDRAAPRSGLVSRVSHQQAAGCPTGGLCMSACRSVKPRLEMSALGQMRHSQIASDVCFVPIADISCRHQGQVLIRALV